MHLEFYSVCNTKNQHFVYFFCSQKCCCLYLHSMISRNRFLNEFQALTMYNVTIYRDKYESVFLFILESVFSHSKRSRIYLSLAHVS